MIWFALKLERRFVYIIFALDANISADLGGLLQYITIVAQRSAIVLDEALVGQWTLTELTVETIWVPAVVEGLNHSAYDELSTFTTTGRE